MTSARYHHRGDLALDAIIMLSDVGVGLLVALWVYFLWGSFDWAKDLLSRNLAAAFTL